MERVLRATQEDLAWPVRLWTDDLPRQHGFEPLEIEGALPPELCGTLFRNGPGQFGQFGRRYSHPFEADGAITAVRFDRGRAFGACKITESKGLLEERAAGGFRYGTAASWVRRMRNGVRNRQKNTANTSVVIWQGRLYALMEAGRPTEIDARDLTTIGETDLDGVVGSFFSAHPHRVASRRAFYNFGLEYGRKTRLHLYELPDAGAARRFGTVELSGAPMLHDFIATESHLVFFISPVRIDVPRAILQLGRFEDLFRWRPELGTEVICVPFDRPDQPVRFSTESFHHWHFANAFTRGSRLVIDYVRYPNFDSFYDIGAAATGGEQRSLTDARAYRAEIDLVTRRLHAAPILDRDCEFPTVAPGREGSPGAPMFLVFDELRALGRLDGATGVATTHTLPPTQRATEPLFVPRPGARADDDGWLVSLCHDGVTQRAFTAVYDARRIEDGAIARVWFDHHVPITFHGAFLPSMA